MMAMYPERVKCRAYALDPSAWISYSGKPREFKRAMDLRRTAALQQALGKIHRICPRRTSYTFAQHRVETWRTSPAMRAALLERNFDETASEYLARKAKETGLRIDQFAMLAYCAALSQGRASWR